MVHHVLFVLYFLISYWVLMRIYGLSTYHKYFIKVLPLLICYGILVGYLLNVFNFSNYFFWYIGITIGFLSISIRQQHKLRDTLKTFTNEDKLNVDVDESTDNTIKFHLLSSISYLISLLTSFIYFTLCYAKNSYL